MNKRSDKVEVLLRLNFSSYDLIKMYASITGHSMSFVLIHMFIQFRKRCKNIPSLVFNAKLNFEDRRIVLRKYLFHFRLNKYIQFMMKDFAFKYHLSFNYLCELVSYYFYELYMNTKRFNDTFESYLREHNEFGFKMLKADYARFNLKKKKKEIK